MATLLALFFFGLQNSVLAQVAQHSSSGPETTYTPVSQNMADLLATGYTISAQAGTDGEFYTLVKTDMTGKSKWVSWTLRSSDPEGLRLSFAQRVISVCRALN